MSYSETLAKMIKESGLTMKEIADQISIDPSYLSKLQSGKQSPASDEINEAIAKACKADPDVLIFEAYLDKAPEVVIRFINRINDSIKDVIIYSLSLFRETEFLDEYRNHLDNLSHLEFINMLSSNNSLSLRVDDRLSIELDKEDLRLANNPIFGIPAKDESMEPLIKKHSLVNIDQVYSEVEEGDIAVLNTPDSKNIIRRVFFIDDQVILIPENKEYIKEVLSKSEVEFIGRVYSIVTKI